MITHEPDDYNCRLPGYRGYFTGGAEGGKVDRATRPPRSPAPTPRNPLTSPRAKSLPPSPRPS